MACRDPRTTRDLLWPHGWLCAGCGRSYAPWIPMCHYCPRPGHRARPDRRVSTRFPGWRTLPGIEIAPLAEKARAQGHPVRQSSYVWDLPARNYVSTCWWQADADGTVTPMGDGWEAITEDGMLTGFRGVKGGTIEGLVQITALVVPEGEPPWSPALTVRLPPEQIGMFRLGDSMADGIDIETGEMASASLSVGYAGDDGSITTVGWAITRESAASVIALIRERHGEPVMEFTAADGDAFHDAAMEAVDQGVFTCAHEAAR